MQSDNNTGDGAQSTDGTERSDRRAAYDATDFEIVEVGNGYEVPKSTSAKFEYSGGVASGSEAERALEDAGFTLISPYVEDNGDGQFYLSSKVYVSETNQFVHVKMTTGGVRVYPKDEDMSLETFSVLVNGLESELGVALEYEGCEAPNEQRSTCTGTDH